MPDPPTRRGTDDRRHRGSPAGRRSPPARRQQHPSKRHAGSASRAWSHAPCPRRPCTPARRHSCPPDRPNAGQAACRNRHQRLHDPRTPPHTQTQGRLCSSSCSFSVHSVGAAATAITSGCDPRSGLPRRCGHCRHKHEPTAPNLHPASAEKDELRDQVCSVSRSPLSSVERSSTPGSVQRLRREQDQVTRSASYECRLPRWKRLGAVGRGGYRGRADHPFWPMRGGGRACEPLGDTDMWSRRQRSWR